MTTRTKKQGGSPAMPYVKLSLGRFVETFARGDGTFRVLFKVPPRLRPYGWLPTIPLPVLAPRTGDLTDAGEVARIQADAERLYKQMIDRRMGRVSPKRVRRDLTLAADLLRDSQSWKDNRPRTNRGYESCIKFILAWSRSNGDPLVDTIGVRQVEDFLSLYDDRPSQRYHMRKVLRLIMWQAVASGWIDKNPVDFVRAPMPKTQVIIWEQADVDRYVEQATAMGHVGLAALILMEWEIGQRLTDVILFRHGAEYDAADGYFRFAQSKTGQRVAIPVSEALRATLTACKQDGSMYLFHDKATKRPFPDVERLGHVFAEIRAAVVKGGGRRLVLRALRHSCIVQLARAGCGVPEISAITGHSISSATQLLGVYLPRDSLVARNAQERRGLVARDRA